METTKTRLKLVIDKNANKVLFAEAEKDFVDFLFNLLSLPVGAVIKLLKGRSTVGCVENVYESLRNLKEVYMQPNLSKDILLNPEPSTSLPNMPMLMTGNESSDITTQFYTCRKKCGYVSSEYGVSCPGCKKSMIKELKLTRLGSSNITTNFYTCESNCDYVTNEYGLSCPNWYADSMIKELKLVKKSGVGPANATSPKGYVQGIVTYMISDDLSVSPTSMTSSITSLTMYNISQLDALEESVVEFGTHEALELLTASFQSGAALTTVFLGKKGTSRASIVGSN